MNLVNSKQSNLGNSNQSNLFISNQSSLFDKEKKGQLHEFKETLESRLALYRSTLESNHTLQTNLNDTCDLIEYCLANTSLFHQIDTHQDSLYLPEGIEKEVMDERKDEMNDEMVERDLLEMRIIQVEGELLVKEDRIRELEEALKYTLDENEQLYSLYHKKSAQ